MFTAERRYRTNTIPVNRLEPSTLLRYLAILVLVPFQVAAALDPDKAIAQYASQSWSTSQGLPHSTVAAILETRDGFLWFGTELGLVRFDGLQFYVFDRTNTAELKSNLVQALAEDRDGNLWIGTSGGGLTRYRDGRFNAVSESFGSSASIQALYVDRAGLVWIGTEGGGAAVYHQGAFKHYTTREGLSDNSVFAFAQDRSGALWIGTHNGLSKFTSGRFSVYTTRDGLPNSYIHSLYPSRDGGLWIGTNGGGIARFRNGTFENLQNPSGVASKAISTLFEDAKGSLWVGTFGAGLARIVRGVPASYNAKNGLNSDEVWSIFEDRSGNLWIGTGGGGVCRLKDGKFTTWGIAQGLSDEVTLGVLQDRSGTVWIGTEHGGLNRFQNGKLTALTVGDGLSDPLVFSLCDDLHGGLWVGTRKGLNYIKDGKIKLFTSRDGLPNDSVLALYLARNGVIWIGTRGGLSKLSDGKFTSFTTEQGLSNNHVTSIREDSKGDLWVGTEGGLNKLHEGKFTIYGSSAGLSNSTVMSLYPDPDGTLWIGTNGGGLNRYRDGRFTVYTTREGLLDDAIFSILDDGRGNLWASSNKGVFSLSKPQLDDFARGRSRSITPVSYGIADGMKTAECNGGFQPAAWKGADDKLWFPTMKGVAVIDLKRMGAHEPAVPVFIERATLNGAVMDPRSPGRAPPARGDLEFVYTGVDFNFASKLAFKYKLEGFDREWIDAGARRTAYYTNIPPGDYQFLVSARNPNGIWNQTAASFGFTLEPHFYQTLWFKLPAILIIFGLIGTAHEIRIRQHDQRERILSRAVAERTKELRIEILEHEQTQLNLLKAKEAAENASRSKSEFLANMSHEIRTPMHGVLGMTELALGTGLTAEQSEYVTLARSSAQSLLSIINDILDFSKIEAGKLELDPISFNLLQLLDECSKSLAIKAHEKGLEMICDVDPAIPEFLVGDPLRLRQILFNLAGNAIKFTLKGEIVVQAFMERHDHFGIWVQFKVKDTGIGIPEAKQGSIFEAFSQADTSTTRRFGGTGLGLGISSRLVQLMGAEIVVHSQVGVGSEFQFSVCFGVPVEARIVESVSGDELGGKSILVVDDNATNRRILAAALTRWGMKVELAENGASALAFFHEAHERHAPFSIVLTDCNMPGMDGFSLVECLRNEGQLATTAVMMLSSGGQNGDVARCQRLQLTSLMKPISLVDLRSALQRVVASVPNAALASTPADGSLAPATAALSLRILLAEDNPINQKIAVRILEKRGHSLTVVSNGAQALDRLEHASFDLLLTDIQMPDMDGFELTSVIRERERITGAHLPIIAMTALAMRGDQERCLAAGMDGYVSKPMKSSELFEAIERFSAPVPELSA